MARSSISEVARELRGDRTLSRRALVLTMGDFVLRVRSNSEALLAHLEDYFGPFVCDRRQADREVLAIERDLADLALPFTDWKREPGKTGRKDAYADLPEGRILLKVRTGMIFVQGEDLCLAAGPCRHNDNQVINFINSQYMNWLQHRRWLICHAAGLVVDGRCLAIAGFSGGGKSTLMLRLLELPGTSYLTNDRLFVRLDSKVDSGLVSATGIAKWPRINPGTIVHNPRLHALIPAGERAELQAMDPAELWRLESKYDVPIEEIFGSGRLAGAAPLGAFLVLNWDRDSAAKTRIDRIDLADRPDLLRGAIMKSPGPFYRDPRGVPLRDRQELDASPYLEALRGIAVYEATGRIDFSVVDEALVDEMIRAT